MWINALLWVVIGSLAGGLRTSRLARSRWWPTLLVDCLIGVAGAVSLAWFVWPAHENPDPNAIFVLDLLWAVAGSVVILGVRELLRRRQ